MIFRYECLKPIQTVSGCFSRDCVLHQNESECINILQPNNQVNTTDIVLQTTSSPYECGRFEVQNMGKFLNCTTLMTDTTEKVTSDITTPMNIEETTQSNEMTTQLSQLTDSVTTTKPNDDTSTPSTTDISTQEFSSFKPQTTHVDISTINQGSSVSLVTNNSKSQVTSEFTEPYTSVYIVTTIEKHTSSRSSANLSSTNTISEYNSKSTTESIKNTLSSTQENLLTIQFSTNDMNKTGRPSGPGVVSSPPTHSTDIPDINTTIKETNSGPMKYWPGIVGGVLGACVVVAVVSYIIYSRRRRMNKRNNDIYNVNPKRWVLEPPEENGTSGKSEIALETEQV
ncbi:location of vulva defective 1-like [Mytilus californianus]|uniref:location of vulva defective 1-like n=1 Tax=Mytilus californianus TaxID=6549 RepID=UPI00224680A3|nr:location of vulva defective 1-like [Mytilus californianus]